MSEGKCRERPHINDGGAKTLGKDNPQTRLWSVGRHDLNTG